MMRVGGSIGVAVLAVVLARAQISEPHTAAGGAAAFGRAFWWSLGLTAVALVPGLALWQAERRARLARAAIAEIRRGWRAPGRAPQRGRGMSVAIEAEPAGADGAAATAFGHTFKRAMAVVRRVRGRDTHRPGELSYAQYGLLFGLAEQGELSASDLASVAEVAPSTATKMLDRLVEAGLVARVRSDVDRRVVMVALTARGAEIVAARRARYENLWHEALAGFSDEQLRGASAVLERVVAMFEEISADCDGLRPSA